MKVKQESVGREEREGKVHISRATSRAVQQVCSRPTHSRRWEGLGTVASQSPVRGAIFRGKLEKYSIARSPTIC